LIYGGQKVDVMIHAWDYDNVSKGIAAGLDGFVICMSAQAPRQSFGGMDTAGAFNGQDQPAPAAGYQPPAGQPAPAAGYQPPAGQPAPAAGYQPPAAAPAAAPAYQPPAAAPAGQQPYQQQNFLPQQ